MTHNFNQHVLYNIELGVFTVYTYVDSTHFSTATYSIGNLSPIGSKTYWHIAQFPKSWKDHDEVMAWMRTRKLHGGTVELEGE